MIRGLVFYEGGCFKVLVTANAKIKEHVVTEWLNHISDYRTFKAIQELRLHSIPKHFKAYPSPQQRIEIQRTVDVLGFQLELFRTLINELPPEEKEAYHKKYYEKIKGVDQRLLRNGRKHFRSRLNEMGLSIGKTSKGWPVFYKDSNR